MKIVEEWGISTKRFLYESPNGQIEGFRISSDRPNGRVIIFSRGGKKLFSAIDDRTLYAQIYFLSKAGFTVYATQNSEGPNSEGKDEYGGKDVEDTLALLKVMKAAGDYTDGDFLGLLGFSRGALEGCLAIRKGLPVTRAVFVGGYYDATQTKEERPDVYKMWKEENMFEVNDENLSERSALSHVNELLHVPMLLLHSKEDPRVPVRQAIEFKAAMGDGAELHLFEGNSHPVMDDFKERNQLIIDWFQR